MLEMLIVGTAPVTIPIVAITAWLLIALRGTTPAQRPKIIRALAHFVMALVSAFRTARGGAVGPRGGPRRGGDGIR
ncbi:hypothetical protein ABTZ99_12485 [Actinosynnema sp. NPDC002837]